MIYPKLIICGSIAIDRIMNFSGQYKDLIHPDKLHVLSLSVLLDKLEETPGGTGANIAASVALIGQEPILLGSAGPDAGDYIKKLSTIGVDTTFIHHSTLQTASFNVITDMADNQIGGFYPGAMSDSDSLSLSPWQDKDVVVVISSHNPDAMRRQVSECQKFRLRLVYDPGQQVSNVSVDDLRAGIATAELLILNDYELGALSKKTSINPEDIKSKLPLVITTFGKDGSIIEGTRASRPIKIPATQPEKLMDPTGAGDAYRAGFLYGYLRQWSLQDCGQLGSVVASFVVEQHGTQVQLSRQKIMARYKQTFNQEVTLA